MFSIFPETIAKMRVRLSIEKGLAQAKRLAPRGGKWEVDNGGYVDFYPQCGGGCNVARYSANGQTRQLDAGTTYLVPGKPWQEIRYFNHSSPWSLSVLRRFEDFGHLNETLNTINTALQRRIVSK